MFGNASNASYRDAIELLEREHEKLAALFQAYDALQSRNHQDRQRLLATICARFSMHAKLEQEILYPMLGNKLGCCPVAAEQGPSDRILAIARRLPGLKPTDPEFGTGLGQLRELVRAHAAWQEQEVFPNARRSGLNLVALGTMLATRRMQLA